MVNGVRFARAALPALFLFSAAVCCYSACSLGKAAEAITHFCFFIHTNPDSGQEMYAQYCAGCHGDDGRGLGPNARHCTVPPANLAILTRKNHGVFPAKRVSQVLHSGTGKTPQGQGYMPVWEPLLQSMNADKPATTEIRIANLTEYVRSLQDRSTPAHRGPIAP